MGHENGQIGNVVKPIVAILIATGMMKRDRPRSSPNVVSDTHQT